MSSGKHVTCALWCPQNVSKAIPCPASVVDSSEPTSIGDNMNHQRMTRRSFLGTTAAAGGALCATRIFAPCAFGAAQRNWPKLSPARIYVIYAGRTGDMYLA